MAYRRHTMGQDGGGRCAANPPAAPRVTADQVRAYAAAAGIEVRRDTGGWSNWWTRRPGDVWRLSWSTNFLMLQALQREFPNAVPAQSETKTHP